MNKEIGKTYTFYALMSSDALRVEVPIIQRDYAQGRDNAREVRTTFLRTLKKHLDQQTPLNLDFVYGSLEHGCFIPIDGQQRLTTLFLLHWYLAWTSGQTAHGQGYLGNGVSRFTYQTRTSSRDFCNRLVSQHPANMDGRPISAFLKNQPWFYLNWKHDPTITGMLNTLDTIEQIFPDSGMYYRLLTQPGPDLITFQYIELRDFGLSDQLYIRMNARGKPLTAFENLKANIERIFEEYDKANGSSHSSWLTSKIDSAWSDVLWSFLEVKSRLVDDLFVNFIRSSVTHYLAVQEGEQKIQHLRTLLNSALPFNFFMLEETGLARFEPLYEAFRQFDSLTTAAGNLFTPLSDVSLLDEKALFKDLVYNATSYSYPRRIQHFALCSYLVRHGSDRSGLKDWMRVIRNLTENSRIEEITVLAKALKTTDRLLSQPGGILTLLAGASPSDLVGFSDAQSNEEILKARLIMTNREWQERIVVIENHPYLRGQIGFILEFCGLTEAVSSAGEAGLKAATEKKCIEQFDDYVRKVTALLHDTGFIDFGNFLFERALLSIGDYLLLKGRNYSFLINGNDRDLSWKNLLRSENRKYLKMLLDRVDLSNLKGSLQALVDAFDEDDFRYFFVKYPEIIAHTGAGKLIRWNHENYILLLEKTQTNGMRRDYYSFAICCELQRKGYEVHYQPGADEDYDSKSIDRINGQEVFVYHYPEGEDSGYWVVAAHFPQKENYFSTHDEVIDFIETTIPLQ